ncbi:CHAT domain-containing protein [Russula dissimulans]|nr:CHAT domain-containing protein [Russula dissimulans]
MVALLTLARSIFYSDPGYSEEAISRCRTALGLSSPDKQLRVVLTQALSVHAEQRFKTFGLGDGLLEARSLNPEIANLLSSDDDAGGLYTSKRAYSNATVVEKINHLEELLRTTTTGSFSQEMYLEELAGWYDRKFSRTGDLVDIGKAITCRRMLLATAHSSHPFSYIPLCFLCDDLLIAFEFTRSVDYLEESIILHRGLLTMQDAQALHFNIMRRLVACLCVRFRLLRRRQDVDEIMYLCPMALNDKYASVVDRFKFLCLWTRLARHFSHPSVSAAYESAMLLMKPSLEFAPTIELQQARLVWMGRSCERMPLDYASYQIHTGRLEQAIEILEQGRAQLWREMRGFRTSADQLFSSDPVLAEKYAAVNRELEMLTVSAVVEGDTSREGSRKDPFGRLVTKQRKLLKEHDALVLQIRTLPGLHRFLTPPSFDTLRSAASRGPVIIVNHSIWRCDILIVLHDAPPSLITTPSDFYDRANRLRDRLLNMRRGYDDVVGWTEYENVVRSVLADLYELVGQPVIERLRVLGIPEQSRVWWCPTSAFCFLPLHAMGPIPSPSRDKMQRYFSDLYIPSYTPTLSALIEARKPVSRTTTTTTTTKTSSSEKPSLLLVAYHAKDLPGMRKEIKVMQGLRHARVHALTDSGATKAAVLAGLQQHAHVHLAGSVKLVPGQPFDAPLNLYAGQRLTLLDLARAKLSPSSSSSSSSSPSPSPSPSAAAFAFLSASHTAEPPDDRSSPDEALHFAAAALHCGFRSVVATMWGMADADGRHVCKEFYKLMFAKDKKDKDKGKGKGKEDPESPPPSPSPCHERAAEALRDAVQKLRKRKKVTVDRWVTYVHYGA